jgi:2-(1,2-epoxy-1,2-dihydrophenyl)acetyl-CoA isomerase
VAFGAIRRSLAFSAGHDLESSLVFEAEMMATTGATRDHREAVAAFMAKQKPTFEGR